jgi:hypothetical protein
MLFTIFMQIKTKNIKKKRITILVYKSKFFVDIFQIRKFIANKKNYLVLERVDSRLFFLVGVEDYYILFHKKQLKIIWKSLFFFAILIYFQIDCLLKVNLTFLI